MKAPHEFFAKTVLMKAFEEEILNWLNEHGGDGVYIDSIEIVDSPSGQRQEGDEYCEQYAGYCEDDYHGWYYHEIEGTGKFLRYHFQT